MSSCNYEIISDEKDDDKIISSSYSIKMMIDDDEDDMGHDEVTLSLLVDSQPSTSQVGLFVSSSIVIIMRVGIRPIYVEHAYIR